MAIVTLSGRAFKLEMEWGNGRGNGLHVPTRYCTRVVYGFLGITAVICGCDPRKLNSNVNVSYVLRVSYVVSTRFDYMLPARGTSHVGVTSHSTVLQSAGCARATSKVGAGREKAHLTSRHGRARAEHGARATLEGTGVGRVYNDNR